MRLLLDTHVLLWWLTDDPRLGLRTRAEIGQRENEVLVSAASSWELAIKVGLGRLALPNNLADWLPEQLPLNGFEELVITQQHALGVERLPRHHGDPFDRLLVSQAICEGLVIATVDRQLTPYRVSLLMD